MGASLDLDDLVADWPEAKAELAELRAEVLQLRDAPQDARELAVSLEGLFFDREAYGSEAYEKKILKASQIIAAYRARILDEAAERGATWLIEQTSHIDPALAATNSGKWLIKLREKQTAGLRAAIKGAAHE